MQHGEEAGVRQLFSESASVCTEYCAVLYCTVLYCTVNTGILRANCRLLLSYAAETDSGGYHR